MGSYKPRSKSDRLPVKYEGQSQHQMSPSNDFAATISVPVLPPEEREARNAAAVRYLTKRGATDLIDILGLGVPEERRGFGQLTVPCPQCQEPPGSPCVGEAGGKYSRGHRGRHRRAQELREAAA